MSEEEEKKDLKDQGKFTFYQNDMQTDLQYPAGYGEGYKYYEQDPEDLKGGSKYEKRLADMQSEQEMMKMQIMSKLR